MIIFFHGIIILITKNNKRNMKKKIIAISTVTALVAGITLHTGSAIGQVSCTPFVVNFNGIQHGEIISGQYASNGVSIAAQGNNGPNTLIAFDTSKTGTPDPDLEVNSGIVAILPANTNDSNGDGLIDTPNDNARGGKQTYTFSSVKNVDSIVFIDKDDNKPGTVKTYDTSNALINTTSIPSAGDGSVQRITVGDENVKRMEVEYRGSGGLGEVVFSCPAGGGNTNDNTNTNVNDNTNVNANTNSNGNTNENEPGTDIPEVSYPALFAMIGAGIAIGFLLGYLAFQMSANKNEIN